MPSIHKNNKLFALLTAFFAAALSIVALEILLTLSSTIFFYSQEQSNQKLEQSGEIKILAIGESTTALGTAGLEPNAVDSWPRQLEDILNTAQAGVKFHVINKGVPGTTSNAIVENLEANLKMYKPHVVIAMMGINDANITKSDDNLFISSSLQTSSFVDSTKSYKLALFLWRTFKKHALFFCETHIFCDEHVYVALLNGHIQDGRFDDGLALIRRTLTRYPRSYVLRILRANIFKYQNKHIEAEEGYKQGIAIDPGNPSGYVELASLYIIMGRYTEAEQFLTTALVKDPQNIRAYTEYGLLLQAQKRYEEAEKFFIGVLDKGIDEPYVYTELEKIYRIQGKENEAEKLKITALSNNQILARNYRTLRDILRNKHIPLVAVQYPMRNIDDLKAMLGTQQGQYIVDNEAVFKRAIADFSYETYFLDRLGGDFGHATAKGNELLAQNIADTIIQNVLPELVPKNQ